MNSKLNKEEIISANDLLSEELEQVIGGAESAEKDLCLKGCISGGVSSTTNPDSLKNPE